MKTRATLLVGALVASGYLGVAVVTAQLSGHRVLPLYEGIGNLPPYQWVNPPAAFKTANVVPKPNTTKIALGASGNKEGAIASSDSQFIVTLSPGAIPGKSGSPSASVLMEPLDPGTLSSLPPGTRADGNAYRLTVTYDPNLGTLPRFAKPTSAVLSVPLSANRGMFSSVDGRRWTRIAPPAPKSQPNQVGASFRDMGIFLAGTTHQATSSGSGSSNSSIGIVILAVVIGVLLVGGAAWFLMRLMRPTPPSRPSSRQAPRGGRKPPPRRR